VTLVSADRRRALNNPSGGAKQLIAAILGNGYGDFAPGSPQYKDILALVNDIIVSFDIETHHKCFSLSAGTDPDCLAAEVRCFCVHSKPVVSAISASLWLAFSRSARPLSPCYLR